MRGRKRNIYREKLDNPYPKEYDELYTVISLVLCYDKALEAFFEEGCHTDNPDFQNEKLDLGIEVTRAYTPQQNEHLPIINNYFGKNYKQDFVREEIKKRFPHVLKHLSFRPFAWFFDYCDTKVFINELQNSIVDKLYKLNNGYRVFQHNWLYLFAGSSVIHETDIANLKNKEMESYHIPFSKIFINCRNKIFVLENYELIKTIFLSDEELTQIKKRAFERVENNAS